ncbi:MAG: DUF423 domain-containing protein [Rudaea sp.]|uniref:DUF423 domain-containing protein n=1 Tax=Rudaea sp. TaxID=2136325 RepID=UPI0039E4316D
MGALLGALGVAFGAFGAHALRGMLDDPALRIWHTAVEYQLWHALALFALAVAPLPVSRWRRAGAYAFALGILLFCGSLYALALGAPHVLGAITPFGGVALIVGWLAAATACLRRPHG